MNFSRVLTVTLLVFSCMITVSRGELVNLEAVVRMQVECPDEPSKGPVIKPTPSSSQPLAERLGLVNLEAVIRMQVECPGEPSKEPVTKPTTSSSQPLTEPSHESTLPPFQPPAEPKPTLASPQLPPFPSQSSTPGSNQPPSQLSPPCSPQPSPSSPFQPPLPYPPQSPRSYSFQPSRPFSSPGLQQSPPSSSNQKPQAGPHQTLPLRPSQLSPPCSPQPSPSSSFQPSTSCPLNSDYRQPLVTLIGSRNDESSFILSRWYFPQPPSNFQTIIEYTIDGNINSVSCENGQLETIQNHDLMTSSLSGLCTLQLPLTNQLEIHGMKFDINNEAKYTTFPIGNENQWMYDSKELLGDLSLSELVIPGTHESAAYPAPDGRSSFGESRDVQHGVLHQGQSIDMQLQGGIRYFDLRPARFGGGSTREYVLMNGLQEPVSLSVIAKQITTFIENSLEIVIVSFRDFSQGFNYKTDHKIFINHLEELFGKYAYTYRPITPKLNDIWRSTRRLILLYHDSMYSFRNFLWPAIPQIEKNFGYPENESSNKRQNRRQTLQAMIPQLLPEGQDLRNAIHNLSTALFNWATGIGRSDVNIIAVDYYGATGVVDLAIQLNQERAREKACTKSNKQNLGFFGWDRN